MTLRKEFKLGQSEFNGFLFALVGEEPSGQEITVLSALSRAGLDPWQEAARLSSLSKTAATKSLTSTLASLPGGHWPAAEAGPIAVRLVAHLAKGRSRLAQSSMDPNAPESSPKAEAQAERSTGAKLGRRMSVETLLRGLELPNWLVWILLIVAVLFVLSRLYADTNYQSDVYTAPLAAQQHLAVPARQIEKRAGISPSQS